LLLRPPPTSPLFPYTTLFRSSTPDPASLTRTRIFPFARILRVSRRTAGGVTSFTQNRNVNLPGFAPAGVSKTTSYTAGAGKIAPDRKSTRLNSSHDQISYAVF